MIDLSIRQTFPRQNFVRVHSSTFITAKLSRYAVYHKSKLKTNYEFNKLMFSVLAT